MASALVRPQHLYGWLGPSLLIVTPRGDCGSEDALTGFYFREARYLRTLRLSIDGVAPWLCEAAPIEPDELTFTYIHPELADAHPAYNPLSYHRGTMWAVEQSTIAFGLRRFGFDARALDLSEGLFALAQLYPGYRIPECVGGYPRSEGAPGAYPRANTPQLWNAAAFPLLLHTILGLQPVAPLETLVIDPVLPSWLPEVILHDLRVAGATATLRFWRDEHGKSHGDIVEKRGTLRLARQPPPESLSAGVGDRAAGFLETLIR